MTSKNPLPTFSGTHSDTLTVTQWIKKAEISTTIYGWDETKCCLMSLLALIGPALQWADMLGNDFTWHHFKDQLTERFGDKAQEVIDKLFNRAQ